MTHRIYIAEDNQNLLDEAFREIMALYNLNLKVDAKGEIQSTTEQAYQFRRVDLPNANIGKYWRELQITGEDLVVVDLHLGDYVDPISREKKSIPFTGRDILSLFQREKLSGNMQGLEKVLVATSLPLEVDFENPSAFYVGLRGFDVYGMEKGRDKTGRITSYGISLAQKISQIYDNFGGVEEMPLNAGWRNE